MRKNQRLTCLKRPGEFAIGTVDDDHVGLESARQPEPPVIGKSLKSQAKSQRGCHFETFSWLISCPESSSAIPD
jgi:hypothetical protein